MAGINAMMMVVVLLATIWCVSGALDVERGPGQTFELTDENFDDVVFSRSDPSRAVPFIVFFYAPWCGHCKAAKPFYYNASEYLMSNPEYAKRSAMFALVDATSNPKLSAKYSIKSFPTLVYSIRSNVYRYEGGRGINELVQFATYLFHGFQLGSFADDVSDPVRFENVDIEAPGRAAFVFYIPRTAPPSSQVNRGVNGVISSWLQIVESLISVGKTRYAVLFEENIPKQVSGTHAMFSKVVDAAKKASRHERGPGGEVLVLLSDAYDGPVVFSGPWEEELAEESVKGATDQFRSHPALRRWVDENSFLAVEPITYETYGILGKRKGLMAIFVSFGPTNQNDVNFLPVLRHIVRSRNKKRLAALQAQEAGTSSEVAAPLMNFTFATLDGALFQAWCEQYGLPSSDFPAFIAVNIKQEVVFHSKSVVPELASALKDMPWELNGVQHRLIENFLDAVEQGAILGDRTTTIGHMAEVALRVPLLHYAHKLLGEDDTVFVTVLGMLVFFVFVIFLALRSDGNPAPAGGRKKHN